MLISAITLSTLPLLAFAAPLVPNTPLINRVCGTIDASQSIKDMHQFFHDNERHDPRLLNATDFRPGNHTKRATTVTLIPVWFHVVTNSKAGTPGNPAYVTDTMLRNQLNFMNKNYQNTTVQYQLVGTTRTINATWAANGDDLSMKKALRKGGYGTLNVYYQSDLQGTGTQAGQMILGFCTLPASGITAKTPASAYVSDGCNILSSTLPGGQLINYNLGGTTVHEVGHWNGLLHTFQDTTCASNDMGDYVADTPQQSKPTDGCPARKDSCPGAPGLDPIHNFMDYSQDSCYEGFTAGQAARMVNMLKQNRVGR